MNEEITLIVAVVKIIKFCILVIESLLQPAPKSKRESTEQTTSAKQTNPQYSRSEVKSAMQRCKPYSNKRENVCKNLMTLAWHKCI